MLENGTSQLNHGSEPMEPTQIVMEPTQVVTEPTRVVTDSHQNGNSKVLKRLETVPDIKRDTSGVTSQYVAAGIVNLGAFCSGMCVAWASMALPLLRSGNTNTRSLRVERVSGLSEYGESLHPRLALSEAEASWATSLLCLGALAGSVPAGLISEYFGRKKTLLYLALPMLISWILVGSSPNVYGLYLGRFVGGVAVGAFSVAIPPYVADITEKELLGGLANIYHMMFSCGVLFGYITGLIPNATWLYVVCASWPLIFFIAFVFLPESPAYLLTQGKHADAKTALRYFRGIDNDIDEELRSIKEHLRNYTKTKITFKELFTNVAILKAMVVSFGLMIFQQLSGIYSILFYAESIFRTFSISLNPTSATIILGFCFVSSTYFSTMLLNKIRRRFILMLSFMTMAVSIGALAVYYHLLALKLSSESTWVVLLTLCIFISAYAAGAGPIPWLMLREIFPSNATRRVTAITVGFHWFLAFCVSKLYQNLVEVIRSGWTFSHYAIICIIGTIFVYFFVPETKGRTLREIENDFAGIPSIKRHRHVIEVESFSDI